MATRDFRRSAVKGGCKSCGPLALSGFNHPCQCGDEVLRMFVTGGPPSFGEGGMPQRITGRGVSRGSAGDGAYDTPDVRDDGADDDGAWLLRLIGDGGAPDGHNAADDDDDAQARAARLAAQPDQAHAVNRGAGPEPVCSLI